MKSLFLRMFLSLMAAGTVVVLGVLIGYGLSNPDQLPFAWPQVGRGAIVSAGRTAVRTYERGGAAELAAYLESLREDTGIHGALFDAAGRELGGFAPHVPRELASLPEEQLLLHVRERLGAVRFHGYAFVARVPRRAGSLFWSRAFVASFLVAGALLCWLLARYVTAPVVAL